MQVRELFIAILEVVGVVTLDEQPEASDMQKVRRHVNLLLGSLSARHLVQLTPTTESFTLTAGVAAYTIGPSADLNTAKPISILAAHINGLPLDLATQGEYSVWPSPTRELYYDAGATQSAAPGIIHINPTPDAADTLTIDSLKYLTSFSALTDTVTFPDAYLAMLTYNGAMACWRPLGRTGPPPPDIRMMAERTMKVIENMNARPMIMRTDVPSVTGGRYNILTGEYQ